jgi:hypothetical protein
VARQVDLFKQGELDLEGVCYWHQALAGAFFASADGVCFAVREAILHNAHSCGIELSEKTRRSLAPYSRAPLEKLAPLAFRILARLFSADLKVDTSDEAFRGFKALTSARESFAHPKNHKEVCPFSLFPTLISAAQWFLAQWRSLLVACMRALGHPLQGESTPIARFRFRDELLTAFARARAEWDEGRNVGDFTEDLAGVVLPVRMNTVRALETYNAKNTITDIPATCRLRNLIRFLFIEIEGSVLIASTLLTRSVSPPASDSRGLLTGPHEEVRGKIADTLDAFGAQFGSGRPVSRTGPGWDAFPPLRELRNRLTHPHSARDLLVGADSLDMALTLASWWRQEAHSCLDEVILKHAKR